MLNSSVSLLLFSLLLLARFSTAQFAAYPVCVQPILTKSFPAACLSDSLAVQNTCLCKDANAAASFMVPTIAQACGCAALALTIQLSNAYCAQVGVDTGPAYNVFVQDDTTCGTGGGSTGSGGGSSVATSAVGSNAATDTAAAVVPTSTQGGSGSGSGTNTQGSSGATVTVTTATPGSTGSASAKSSDANRGLVIEEVRIGVGFIVAGMMALWW